MPVRLPSPLTYGTASDPPLDLHKAAIAHLVVNGKDVAPVYDQADVENHTI